MDAMVKDHEDDINEFQQYARFGEDADLKKFAEQTLPTLNEHLAKAQAIDKDQDAAAAANEADVGGDREN
jgi:putative membrane protein